MLQLVLQVVGKNTVECCKIYNLFRTTFIAHESLYICSSTFRKYVQQKVTERFLLLAETGSEGEC